MKTNLITILLLILFLPSCSYLYNQLGAPYNNIDNIYSHKGLSKEAKQLIDDAFKGLDEYTINDFHIHFFGNGKLPENNEICTSLKNIPAKQQPKTNFTLIQKHQPWYYPNIKKVSFVLSDITDENKMDEQFTKRLLDLVRYFGPPKHFEEPQNSPYKVNFYLMAMDGVYNEKGIVFDKTFNYISNQYIISLVTCLNKQLKAQKGFIKNKFKAVGSINPMMTVANKYKMRPKTEWMKELKLLSNNGVQWIKWRPSSMQIDPKRVDESFYTELEKRKIGILTHTGSSDGFKLSDELNSFASPNKMEKALKLGVKVTMLHIGRKGEKCNQTKYSNEFFELLAKYPSNQLKGELSALPYNGTQGLFHQIKNYSPAYFINGSDYPATSIYLIVASSLTKLVQKQWLKPEQEEPLDEIYRYNPLLFDFVLKHTLNKNGYKLPISFFTQHVE